VFDLPGKNALLRQLELLSGLSLNSVALVPLVVIVKGEISRALARGFFIWEPVSSRGTVGDRFPLRDFPTTVEPSTGMQNIRIVFLAALVHLLAFTLRPRVVRHVGLLAWLNLDSLRLPAPVEQLREVVIVLN
jgi:hypothetical protein